MKRAAAKVIMKSPEGPWLSLALGTVIPLLPISSALLSNFPCWGEGEGSVNRPWEATGAPEEGRGGRDKARTRKAAFCWKDMGTGLEKNPGPETVFPQV